MMTIRLGKRPTLHLAATHQVCRSANQPGTVAMAHEAHGTVGREALDQLRHNETVAGGLAAEFKKLHGRMWANASLAGPVEENDMQRHVRSRTAEPAVGSHGIQPAA